MKATEVTAGLAESNGSLLPGPWRDSLHVTCGLTACTPGSAPGPTLVNEYGKTLPFYRGPLHSGPRGLCPPCPLHCHATTIASFVIAAVVQIGRGFTVTDPTGPNFTPVTSASRAFFVTIPTPKRSTSRGNTAERIGWTPETVTATNIGCRNRSIYLRM